MKALRLQSVKSQLPGGFTIYCQLHPQKLTIWRPESRETKFFNLQMVKCDPE